MKKVFATLVIPVLVCVSCAFSPARAATFTVTKLTDDNTVGTLRVAMNDANAVPGSTIDFAVSGTITVTRTLPEVTAAMTIAGPTSSKIAIDGAGACQIFLLDAATGTVRVSNLTIQDGSANGGNGVNGAGHGGGMWAAGASVVLSNCTFSNNYSTFGGGLSCSGNVTLINCTFNSNGSSSWGSGALETYGTVAMTNCTLSGNSCSGSPGAGAIMIAGATTMTNCTISGNNGSTGGIWCYQGTATLKNCIVYGDSSEVGSYSGSMNATYSDIEGGYTGANNFDADPMLGPLADNGGPTQTLALLQGSPCFDAGTATGAPTTDQRGVVRPVPPSLGAWDEVLSPAPVLSSISPTTLPAGSARFWLTANGYRFLPRSVVEWNGAAIPTVYVSATKLTALVPAADVATIGTASVTVFTSASRATSAVVPFIVSVPRPVLSSITPTTATVGSKAFLLTVTGSYFMPRSVVYWNGSALPTAFESGSELRAAVSASLVAHAGTASVTVFTSAPGGGTSEVAKILTITIPPAPVLSSISPTTVLVGSARFWLTVSGSRFLATTVVHWSGAALPTVYVSGSELQALVSSTLVASVGTADVTAYTPAPGGGTSAAARFTIAAPPAPILSSINPWTVLGGSARFWLTVSGSRFVPNSVVHWNGAPIPTNYVSGSELTALVSSSLIATPGTALVTVYTPAPGGGTSASVKFTIASPPPPLTEQYLQGTWNQTSSNSNAPQKIVISGWNVSSYWSNSGSDPNNEFVGDEYGLGSSTGQPPYDAMFIYEPLGNGTALLLGTWSPVVISSDTMTIGWGFHWTAATYTRS